MNSAESFSASYDQARRLFLESAGAAGAKIETFSHPKRGPANEPLSTDVAWMGPADAERVLVLISGTHGVEGFCGSGAQVDWLRRGESTTLAKGVSVLMIHAINPYGFAWTRRVNEDNVDLNRNWIDFASPPSNLAYAELADALCPRDWGPDTQAQANAAIRQWSAAHGAAATQQAITAGQYTHPNGVFYGGREPSWSRKTQTEIFQSFLGQAAKIAIIDYHSGLGPRGFAEQMLGWPRTAAPVLRAKSWFGAAVTSTADGSSTSADVTGDGLIAASALLAHAEVTDLTLEVGTAPGNVVLHALRADAWLHAYGDLDTDEGRAIKAEIRRAFYCEQDDWKGAVCGQSLLACRQALAGLAQ